VERKGGKVKRLIARKTKDGYLAEIIDSRYLKTRDEVMKLAKENGLKVFKGIIRGKIYAD